MPKKLKIIREYFVMIFWYIWIIKNKIRIFALNRFIHFHCHIRGVKTGSKIIFNGFPKILRYRNSRITLGNNCTFNSSKYSVPIGPIKPCTFITLTPGSEIIIGNNVGITGSRIVASIRVEIGNNTIIGLDCSIFDTDFHSADPRERISDTSAHSRPVNIKENTFIGANCIILKGVTIGKNCAIGAGSVVISDIPDNSIAIGNPCKVVIKKNLD